MNAKTIDCPRCGIVGRLSKRSFSDQAVAALLIWGDLEESLVGQAICDGCYGELRDVLIERCEELKHMDVKDLTKAS
jgi:hypothetical protein